MTIGGRSNVATPARRRRDKAAMPASVASCLTESFDGASWPIGADLTWDEGHTGQQSNGSGFGTQYSTDGSTSASRTLHVVSNRLTVKGPDDSLLDGGGYEWYQALGQFRETTDGSSIDMTVTATLANPPPHANAWETLIARNNAGDPGEDTTLAYSISGFFGSFQQDFAFLEVVYSSPFNSGFLQYAYVNDTAGGLSYTPTIGDLLSLTVTGTSPSIVATLKINGSTVLTATETDFAAAISAFTGDTTADFPLGLRSGGILTLRTSSGMLGANWDHGTLDDVLALDDFSACPA